MKTFEDVKRFIVPSAMAAETDNQLRKAGHEHLERFVLWSGIQNDGAFFAQTLHVPRQFALRSSEGLCVQVNGDELHRLNVWLYERKQVLAVQVHSHPTEAYHSETDDTYPIVTTRGGLSLVVPDFGRDGVRGEKVASYRLGPSGWVELSAMEAAELLHFEE